jgi:hypothetical protein
MIPVQRFVLNPVEAGGASPQAVLLEENERFPDVESSLAHSLEFSLYKMPCSFVLIRKKCSKRVPNLKL